MLAFFVGCIVGFILGTMFIVFLAAVISMNSPRNVDHPVKKHASDLHVPSDWDDIPE